MNKQTSYIVALCLLIGCKTTADISEQSTSLTNPTAQVSDTNMLLSEQEAAILLRANEYLNQPPVPLTEFSCPRSAGGIHDFYSEGDYWWQNPEAPSGPYIRRDGQSNPNNFVAHRKAMRNLNLWVSTLVSAYKISMDDKYALHALKHLEAFFLHKDTYMEPSLLYAQAITGRVTGRGIGIIDTIHLIETAKAIGTLEHLGFLTGPTLAGLREWFDKYADWLTTHPYGLDEKDHGNNHSTWWAAQLAAFAQLASRQDLLAIARGQFKKLIQEQMAEDGSFPEELSRTKPYSYTLFNLEGYSVLAQIASTPEDNLWNYTVDSKGLYRGWQYMAPYIKDKSSWIKPPDVQHFDELPIQSAGLLFAAKAYNNQEWLTLWSSLSPVRKSEEVIRTYPLWNPILWIKTSKS